MDGPFVIRRCRARADRHQLESLGLPEKYIRQYTNAPPLYYLLNLLGACVNEFYLMTAAGSDKVVGTILLRRRLDLLKGESSWKIHAVFVAPELRGKGLGAELMRYAFKRLLELGVREVGLKVDQDNQSAINLYQKLGFDLKERVEDQCIFVKQLR